MHLPLVYAFMLDTRRKGDGRGLEGELFSSLRCRREESAADGSRKAAEWARLDGWMESDGWMDRFRMASRSGP